MQNTFLHLHGDGTHEIRSVRRDLDLKVHYPVCNTKEIDYATKDQSAKNSVRLSASTFILQTTALFSWPFFFGSRESKAIGRCPQESFWALYGK